MDSIFITHDHKLFTVQQVTNVQNLRSKLCIFLLQKTVGSHFN